MKTIHAEGSPYEGSDTEQVEHKHEGMSWACNGSYDVCHYRRDTHHVQQLQTEILHINEVTLSHNV
jgi:hypothetical protein